jgi:hypothetical protein
MEVGESRDEISFGEIRPHAVSEEKFGVGTFPEKKVREPLLAAGADEQVNFGVVRSEGPSEVCSEGVGRYRLGWHELGGSDRRGACDGVSRRIVDGDAEMKTATGNRGSLGPLDRLQDRCRKAIATADHFEASALLAEAIGFKAEEGAQKPEDALDFGGGTTPVIGGEGVESEAADADLGRVLDDATSSSQAGAMSGNTG